ncbi:b(0,+)-type amino acid transporter 1-like [Pollicipes pollicipes]|uniref:b(0,+)-type amino acid transporter 1-like n=1 Tax=Pollicipes pollicipes TaxID=41117 RepID=UPI00188597F4|nr:b(0,+)-type amino acid transporter 1-like [Pollicipes pollicipes]
MFDRVQHPAFQRVQHPATDADAAVPPRSSRSQDSMASRALIASESGVTFGGGDGARAPVRMPRTVGAASSTAIIVGTMIGSGIFVSPQGVLERTGSVALSLLVWMSCGVLSALGALCYIELGLLIPESGGEFAYLFHGLGPLHRFFGPLPAFLQTWTTNFITMPASTAVLSLAFAEYCVQPFYARPCAPPPMAVPLLAVITCCLLTFINCYSVTWATRAQKIFTVSKLATIGLIVAAGTYSLVQGNSQYLATGFQGSTSSVGDVATAFYSGLFAYDGWNNLNCLTEEIVKPARNLPLAILIAVPLVTVCYILTNVAYLAVLSPQQLLDSSAVAVSFSERVLGPAAFLIPVGVALSVCGALNGTILSTARRCFASARQGHLVDVLSFIHVRRLTPTPAAMFNCGIAVIMITVGNIGSLIDLFSFCAWIFYGLVVLTLIILRKTRPAAERAFRVPIWIPWLVLLMSCYLVVGPMVDKPQFGYFYVIVFLLFGVLVYIPCVYYKWTPNGMRSVTACLQKTLELAPAS